MNLIRNIHPHGANFVRNKTTYDRLSGVFSRLIERPDFSVNEIRMKVAIISTPRCGSSMFCDVLYNTGNFGEPKEWFNPLYFHIFSQLIKQQKFSYEEYIDFIFRKTTSLNGVFAVNFHVDQYESLLMKHHIDLFDLDFDKIYYLKRRDKLAQAMSLTKAILTRRWHADDKIVKDIPKVIPRESILKQLLFIAKSESFYEHKMQKYADDEFFYEDYACIDTTSVFEKVITDCDITIHDRKWNTSLQKLSDDKGFDELQGLKDYLGCK